MNTPTPALSELASRYADGHVSAAELATLEHAIQSDAEFRRWFVRFLHLDAALVGRPGNAVPLQPLRPDSGAAWMAATVTGGRLGWWWRTGAVAAAALLLVLIGAWLPLERHGNGIVANVTTTNTGVQLVASTNAQWAEPEIDLSLRAGDLPQGLLRLESGSAEFRFQLGATAVLLGPAEVRFTGANDLYVQSGQVLCRCPTVASRITLTTPTTQVVDLGTEFAVAVAPDAGATKVAVISGAVQVGTATTAVLRTGESAQVDRTRVLSLMPLPATTFAELIRAAAPTTPAAALAGANLLQDPGFSRQPPNVWRLTDGHAELHASDATLRIAARGHRFWPSARQVVRAADLAGHLICVSVAACSAPTDPLQERQTAILKLVFVDERGREFAQASRHFLTASTASPGVWTSSQVATFAPAGTDRVEIQLLLNARNRPAGSVWFREPVLWRGPSQQTP
jgi:hypothetical protein